MSLFEEGAFFTTPPGEKIILKFDPQFDHFGVKLEKMKVTMEKRIKMCPSFKLKAKNIFDRAAT